MAAKLKSITRQIHWSLLLRAAAFALAWLYVPFWVFLLVALYCYCVPIFRADKFAVPFGVLLILTAFHSPDGWMAFILGAIFYYLLLIKDLLVIDRTTARSILVMILSFFLLREFYAAFSNGPLGLALFGALVAAILFGLLMHNLLDNFRRSYEEDEKGEKNVRNVVSCLSVVLMAQCLVVGLFLPLDFIYQSVLIFLFAALMVDLLPNQVFGNLSWDKIRLTSFVCFALTVIILVSAKWSL